MEPGGQAQYEKYARLYDVLQKKTTQTPHGNGTARNQGEKPGNLSTRIEDTTRGVRKNVAEFVACAEGKSPKGTWFLPLKVYLGLALWAVLISGWLCFADLTPQQAEFATRGFWGDPWPPRVRQ